MEMASEAVIAGQFDCNARFQHHLALIGINPDMRFGFNNATFIPGTKARW
jgi:hypothetical protein